MKIKSLSITLAALACALLLSTPVYADKVNCGKIDNKDLKEECKDVKKDNKKDKIEDNDIINDGRVKCRNIENDKLRRECREKKFD